MSFNIAQLHDIIDELFEGRKESEKIIFYSTPFILFAFLSYSFLLPMSEKIIAGKKTQRDEIAVKIKESKTFLNSKNEILKGIELDEANNKVLKIKLENKKNENIAVANKFTTIDFVNMSEQNSLEFVDYIAATAGKYDINIINMYTSTTPQEKGIFKKELAADINCSGSFGKMLSFVNAIESSKMFSKIDALDMRGGKEVNASISIKVNGL